MTREERVEAAAKALWRQTYGDQLRHDDDPEYWAQWLAEAAEAVDAAFHELAAGTHWIAPMEPDVGMFGAAWGEAQMLMREAGGAIGKDELVHVLSRYWDAMRDAYLNPPPSADTEHGE